MYRNTWSLHLRTSVPAIVMLLIVGSVQADSVFTAELGPEGVQKVPITLDSYSYVPSHVIVQVGKPVELTLTSETTLTPHNFVLKDADAGLNIDQDVGAGKTVKVRFTPNRVGSFPFYCDKKLLFFASHREKGMEGRLEVR